MCELISWIEYKGQNYWLEDKDVDELMRRDYTLTAYDVAGHSAVEIFYNLKGKGQHKQYPIEATKGVTKMPPEIKKALKAGRMNRIMAGIKQKLTHVKGEEYLFESWYDNGKRWARYTYKNGKLDGLFESWYSNGKPWKRYTYKNGKLDGLFESWYDNGKRWARRTYKNGELLKGGE